MWNQIIQKTVASCTTEDCPDFYKIAKQLRTLGLVNKQFFELVKRRPEYIHLKSLQSLLPILTKTAEKIVSADLHRRHPVTLHTLDKISPKSGPSLLGLMRPKKRAKFVKRMTHDKNQDRITKLQVASRLIKTGACLDSHKLKQLIESRQALKLDECIEAIAQQVDLHLPANSELLAYKICNVVDAVLTQPISSQLQKLFIAAKKIPNENYKAIALAGLYRAMPFLPEEERNALFNLSLKSSKQQPVR